MNVREDHIVEVWESRNSKDSSRDSANGSRQAPYAWITSKESLVPLAFTNPTTDLSWRTFMSTCRSSVKPAFQKWAVRNRFSPEGSHIGLLV